jgi:hypothetical protein
MQHLSCSTNPPPPENQQPPAQATCPVCSGGMFEARGTLHCARCHFSLCVGCEAGGADNFLDMCPG